MVLMEQKAHLICFQLVVCLFLTNVIKRQSLLITLSHHIRIKGTVSSPTHHSKTGSKTTPVIHTYDGGLAVVCHALLENALLRLGQRHIVHEGEECWAQVWFPGLRICLTKVLKKRNVIAKVNIITIIICWTLFLLIVVVMTDLNVKSSCPLFYF